ncbi:MAG: N-acetyl sugar amidotransferase [Candidatus Paceibacterota bacterium]|jgi:N-acetyl sugar amidotransferase
MGTTPTGMYGLPTDVKFCKKCVISNQAPTSAVEFTHTAKTLKNTLPFNEEGICDPCRAAAAKRDAIDWGKREDELKALCDKHRSSDGSYDCLVPGSGGKDSFMAAHLLKYKYGMHPLTCTWAPAIYTPWGLRNLQRWIHAGFDNYLATPNGRTHRLLARLSLENIFHPFQPFIIGQKGLAPKIAQRFNIPLVFYGESEAEYASPIADGSSAQRDWKYFTTHDESEIHLGGVSLKELKEKYGVERGELAMYLPTDPEQVKEAGIEVHYLGYYHKWHPQGAYYYAVEHGGFEASPERTPGTYSKYISIDDKIDDLHYWTTFIKFGFGRATYDASQEIRNGEITREEGVALVKRFDGEFPERFIDELLGYLSITEKEFPKAFKEFEHPAMDREYFMQLADKFRAPHLWKKEDGEWKLRHHVY